MKFRVLAPEVTLAGKQHQAGKQFSSKPTPETDRLERIGYIIRVEEAKK